MMMCVIKMAQGNEHVLILQLIIDDALQLDHPKTFIYHRNMHSHIKLFLTLENDCCLILEHIVNRHIWVLPEIGLDTLSINDSVSFRVAREKVKKMN